MLPDARPSGLFREPAAFACCRPLSPKHLHANSFRHRRVKHLLIREFLRDMQPPASFIAQAVAISSRTATKLVEPLFVSVPVQPRNHTERRFHRSPLADPAR